MDEPGVAAVGISPCPVGAFRSQESEQGVEREGGDNPADQGEQEGGDGLDVAERRLTYHREHDEPDTAQHGADGITVRATGSLLLLMARLATATEGAAENSPENAL